MLDRIICVGTRVRSVVLRFPTCQSSELTELRMCLARGRCYTVPITPILRGCDQWHLSSIADTMDGHLVSMAVLRRDLVSWDITRRNLLEPTKLTDKG